MCAGLFSYHFLHIYIVRRENHNLSVDYEVQAKVMREKTARLKALRLAKEAAEKKNSGA